MSHQLLEKQKCMKNSKTRISLYLNFIKRSHFKKKHLENFTCKNANKDIFIFEQKF